VLFINTAYTRTTGIRPEDVLGRRVSDIETEGKLYRGSVTAQVLERRERVNSVATILGSTRSFWSPAPGVRFRRRHQNGGDQYRDFPSSNGWSSSSSPLTEESRKDEELAYLRRQQAGDKQLSTAGRPCSR
jgi:hypothetical protein